MNQHYLYILVWLFFFFKKNYIGFTRMSSGMDVYYLKLVSDMINWMLVGKGGKRKGKKRMLTRITPCIFIQDFIDILRGEQGYSHVANGF